MTATVSAAVQRRFGVRAPLLVLTGYLIASTIGGALVGVILAQAGATIDDALAPGLLVFAGAAALADLAALKLPRLYLLSGVPPTWLGWGPASFFGAYGFVLGMGLLTPTARTAALYALAAILVFQGNALTDGLVFGTYGLVRAASTIVAGIATSNRDLGEILEPLPHFATKLRRVLGVAALATVMVVFFAAERGT